MSDDSRTETTRTRTWAAAVRSPWTVVCAVTTVVLGPATATASALDRANRAPLHRTAEPHRAPGHLVPGAGRAAA